MDQREALEQLSNAGRPRTIRPKQPRRSIRATIDLRLDEMLTAFERETNLSRSAAIRLLLQEALAVVGGRDRARAARIGSIREGIVLGLGILRRHAAAAVEEIAAVAD